MRTLESVIATQQAGGARDRGLREVREVEAALGAFLGAPLYAEVDDLSNFPLGNQVLARREGYREVYLAYLQSQSALSLTWSGGELVFAAGQRDVAALYEYWCYLEVASVLRDLCEEWHEHGLLERSPNRINLRLRRGERSVVHGTARRLGRLIDVRLYFNRPFGTQAGKQSWSVQMRPDCSISLTSDDEVQETWIHLDAKYRIDTLAQIFGDESEGIETEPLSNSGTAKREDLLKMHAYRDAIRRSAGSYVLYPGGDPGGRVSFREYHEVLPGLGAFALQPSAYGPSIGRGELTSFLNDVLNHRASVTTQNRRAVFWTTRSYGGDTPAQMSGARSGSEWPPADTGVLLGYVRDARHLSWVHAQRRYNLRTGDRRGAVGLDGRELAAEFILLYGPPLRLAQLVRTEGQPEVWAPERMVLSGYRATSHTYLCIATAEGQLAVPPELTTALVTLLARDANPSSVFGAPVVVSWSDVARLVAAGGG